MKRLRSLSSFKKDSLLLKRATHTTVSQNRKMDFTLLGIVSVLVLFGLLMVYDSSQFEAFKDYGDKYYFFRSQVMWVVLGFLALGFFSFFDYHRLQKIAFPGFILSLVLLFLVFIPGFGVSAGGAHRWLRIFGFTIQPAEIIKLSSIVFLATYFQDRVRSSLFLIVLGLVGAVIGILQKDLGSAVVFSMICFGIYFLANAPIIHFGAVFLAGILGFVGIILIAPYRMRRIAAFLDPFADPQGFSYHISQVLIALGSGGFWGLGVGQSRQKYSFIPEVTTDSIFSVVGEEFGFVGGVMLISLMTVLIWRGFRVTETAGDSFGKLLAFGLTIWLGVQAIVNLAAMVSLIPLTGVPLPFISYGGSALLANLVAVGILLNISKQANVQKG